MLLAAAPPQLALALKKVHAVDEAVLVPVIVRAPEAEQIFVLVHKDASVKLAQAFGRLDVEDQQPAGPNEKVETTEDLAEILGREIVDPVERADGRVHRAVEVELLRALTDEKRRGRE